MWFCIINIIIIKLTRPEFNTNEKIIFINNRSDSESLKPRRKFD